MDDDYGQDCDGINIPVSMIQMIQHAMLDAVDAWHEERGIDDMDLRLCLVAMMAAVDATAERMVDHVSYKGVRTVQ